MAFAFTDENTAEIIESGKPVVIDFWAEWCGPCKKVAPIVDELAQEFEGKVTIGKYNVDDDSDIATQYGIRNIPTILFFKDGKLVDKNVGSISKGSLEEKINALLYANITHDISTNNPWFLPGVIRRFCFISALFKLVYYILSQIKALFQQKLVYLLCINYKGRNK